MRISDWRSDVCSSDLRDQRAAHRLARDALRHRALVHLFDHRLRYLLFPVRRVAHARRARAVSRAAGARGRSVDAAVADLRSEEHTSELQSLMRISYAVFCLKKKKTIHNNVV